MDRFRDKLTKKNIFIFLIVIILILAIPIELELLQKTQIFKSRASIDTVKFTGPNISCDAQGFCTTISADIEMEVLSPIGPPVSAQ